MILLLVFILTSDWTSAVEAAPIIYQREEDDNITIRWDSQVHTDLSHINIVCWFFSGPVRVLYHMTNGVEVPESQDQQFAGRVQMDRDALREGRVRVHLSRLRTEDSGRYRCEMTADYDPTLRRWGVQDSVHVVLNVKQVSPGQTATGADQPEEERPPADTTQVSVGAAAFIGVAALVGTLAVILVYQRRHRAKLAKLERERCEIMNLLLYISTRQFEDRAFVMNSIV